MEKIDLAIVGGGAAGLSAALIGQVTTSADDRLWTINGDRTSIPLLSRDELARFLDMA